MNNNTKFLEISRAHRISRLLLLLAGCIARTLDEAILWKRGGEKGRKTSPCLLRSRLPGMELTAHFILKGKNPVTNSPWLNTVY